MTPGGRAEEWRQQGSCFQWAPRHPRVPPVNVFHVEVGPEDAPVLLLVHGFPTCSIDWFAVVRRLRDRFRICALDFPGYGFSDKPLGWGYTLGRDAELLRFYVDEVVGAGSITVMAHDRGSSVALQLALGEGRQEGRDGRRIRLNVEHLVLTDGNLFLPLSNLTEFQRLVLDASTASDVLDVLTPPMLAAGMGTTTFSPPRSPDDPDVEALIDTFAHADGVRVLHETIQYLVERAEHERDWLQSLAGTNIPTTLIWGLEDTVSPLRVANHVWGQFLMFKPGVNRFYVVPGANHYLQLDKPDAVVSALSHALDPHSEPSPGPIGPGPDGAVLIDTSRPGLPDAVEVLARTT